MCDSYVPDPSFLSTQTHRSPGWTHGASESACLITPDPPGIRAPEAPLQSFTYSPSEGASHGLAFVGQKAGAPVGCVGVDQQCLLLWLHPLL